MIEDATVKFLRKELDWMCRTCESAIAVENNLLSCECISVMYD